MAFCNNCGHVLHPTAKFCGGCGTVLDTPQTDNSQNQTNYTPPPQTNYTPPPQTNYTPPPQTNYTPPPPPKQKRSMGKAKKFGIGFCIFIVIIFALGVAVSPGSDSGPRAPGEMSESEKIDQILFDFPERIQQLKREQIEDCKNNMAYLQSTYAGDIYKEKCINAVLGR
jgi:hypothetical protein